MWPNDMQMPLDNSPVRREPQRRGGRGKPDATQPTAATALTEESSEPKPLVRFDGGHSNDLDEHLR
jgi:hypothetical protein